MSEPTHRAKPEPMFRVAWFYKGDSRSYSDTMLDHLEAADIWHELQSNKEKYKWAAMYQRHRIGERAVWPMIRSIGSVPPNVKKFTPCAMHYTPIRGKQ